MADDLLSMFAVRWSAVVIACSRAQSMGTTDHNTLIEQFCTIISGCEPEVANFFLEASSWSLQGAIASYMDSGTMVEYIPEEQPEMGLLLLLL